MMYNRILPADINHLAQVELTYELSIRGIAEYESVNF